MSMNILPLLDFLTTLIDPYTQGHSNRLKELAIELAMAAGVHSNTVEMENIELGAAFHDIGKFGIPEAIRRQQGAYMPSERLTMESHTIIGARILKLSMNGNINPEVVKIAKYHHEKWDGSGYPDGLEGMQIPLGARMISICDSFDAMTHNRGYRVAMTETEALEKMQAEQIKAPIYDPTLLRLFFELRKAKAA